jgi:hypothetical protein
LFLLGPRPTSLLHSTRSNTITACMRHILPIGPPSCCGCEAGFSLLNSLAGASSYLLLIAAVATPRGPCSSLCAYSPPREWRLFDEDVHLCQDCLLPGRRLGLRWSPRSLFLCRDWPGLPSRPHRCCAWRLLRFSHIGNFVGVQLPAALICGIWLRQRGFLRNACSCRQGKLRSS